MAVPFVLPETCTILKDYTIKKQETESKVEREVPQQFINEKVTMDFDTH